MTANYCPECGGQLMKGNTFCGECGHKIIEEEAIVEIALKHCTSCDYSTKEDEQFCPECGGALTSTKNEDAKLNPQVQVPRKKKTRQFAKTITADPVRKKKGGVLRTLRRVVLWGFALLIVAATILYFIGDNPDPTSAFDSNRPTKEGASFVEMPDKAIIKKGKIIAEGTIFPEDARLESDDGKVAMSFDPLCFDEPIEGKIVKVKVENPPENTILNIYDFKLGSMEELGGIATLTVPYDASKIPAGMTASECVTGVYYHEDLHEWVEETSVVDEDRQVVIISTTHLSGHGPRINLTKEQEEISDKLLRRIGKGTPYEIARPIDAKELVDKLTKKDMEKILSLMKAFGAGDPNRILSDAFLKFIGDSGSFLGIGSEFLKLAPYSKAITKKLSDRLTQLGGALIVMQLVSDVYFNRNNGDIAFNTAKGLYFLGSLK